MDKTLRPFGLSLSKAGLVCCIPFV